MNLDLSNRDFCAFLLTQFPFAMDEEKEITLLDYIVENLETPTDEFLDKLTGQTYVLKLNADLTLFAKLGPMGTSYYFNERYLGNSGGHFHLSLLSWQELKQIVSRETHAQSPLFFLLLPLTMGSEEQISEIGDYILKRLQNMALNITSDESYDVVKFLISHLVFRDEEMNILHLKESVGWVTLREHSERNHLLDAGQLRSINELIKLASGEDQ